jgi:hypothetical protein
MTVLILYFSDLSIEDIFVKNSNNDCLDFSYGNYLISKSDLSYCEDKAMSVGEKSNLRILNLEAKNSNIGIASKDSSTVKLQNFAGKNINYCMAAYRKKKQFNYGKIYYQKNDCKSKISNLNLFFSIKKMYDF